jgi:hypothetical protein
MDRIKSSKPDMVPAAIVIFGFNRPASFERLAQNLADCPSFAQHPLYIFIDGPRDQKDAALTAKAYDHAVALDHPIKTIVQRDQNMGLQASLRQGITMVFQSHDALIVLEDDLIIAPTTLDYFQTALDAYQNDQRVASICGYAPLDLPSTTHRPNMARFLPMTHPWGWATWKDRWENHLDWLTMPIDDSVLASSALRSALNVYGIRNYRQMLRAAERNLVSSWWIYWHYNAVLNHQLSLFPPQTLILNAGMKEGGTHASRLNIFRGLLPKRRLYRGGVNLPDQVSVDFVLLDQIACSREARLLRLQGFLGWIKRRIGRIIRR